MAEFSKDAEDAEALIEAADRELYKAKLRRNCICPNDDDRRRDFRRPVRSLVECASLGESVFQPALSVNISEVGMALGCDWRPTVGSTIKLKFKKPYWTYDVDLNATVRQTKQVGELNYVGMEFQGGFSGDLGNFRSHLDAYSHAA